MSVRSAALAAACVLLAACAGPGTAGKGWTILPVPDVPWEGDLCGPAALAAVLGYHGRGASLAELATETFRPGLRGALIHDLAAAARARGLTAAVVAGDPDLLRREVAAGRPPLVLVDRGGLVRRPHYYVVAGTGPDGGFLLASGAERRAVKEGELLRSWGRLGRLAILVGGTAP